jgi:hypothetical protein
MTIESLAESFREAKAKAGHPARIKYPKKLKDAAIEYFKENPKLTPSTMASMIGISTSCADKWFKSVKAFCPGIGRPPLPMRSIASKNTSDMIKLYRPRQEFYGINCSLKTPYVKP